MLDVTNGSFYRGGVTPYISVPYWILSHSKYFFSLFFFGFLEVALIPSFLPPLKTDKTLAYRNPSLRMSFLSHHAYVISPPHCPNVHKVLPTDMGKGSIYITKYLLSEFLQSCGEAKVTTLVSWHFLSQLHSVSAAYGIVWWANTKANSVQIYYKVNFKIL